MTTGSRAENTSDAPVRPPRSDHRGPQRAEPETASPDQVARPEVGHLEPDVFTVALLKGMVEGDPTAHFGSLGGFEQHLAVARAFGLVEADGETPTDRARTLDRRHGLVELPPGRAYLAWRDSPVVDAVVADLVPTT